MNPQIKHQAQTPTMTLTTIGYLALAIYALRRLPGSDWAAFTCLAFSGFGGVAMALGGEVQRKGAEWGWRGLYRSLRKPSRTFAVAFAGHLPQLITCCIMAYCWRRRGCYHAR